MVTNDNKRATLQRDFDAVKDDLSKLKADGRNLASTAYDSGYASAVEAKGALQDALKVAATHGKKGLSLARDQVGNRPGTALAAAFGVGLVLGLVLMSRRA